jgi:hypothetical protein
MRWKESIPNSRAMEILIPPEISSLVLVQEIGLGYLGKLRPRSAREVREMSIAEGKEQEDWNERTMIEEAKVMTRKSTITHRSPIKGTFATSIPPAPKKPAATKAITIPEDNEDDETNELSTPSRPSHSIQVPATPTKPPSPSIQVPAMLSETTIQEIQGTPVDSFKASLQAAINIIVRNRDKLASAKTVSKTLKDEVALELSDIITIMEGLKLMNDNMDSI